MRYNAHITQSQDQVADLGSGITSIGSTSPQGKWHSQDRNWVYDAMTAPVLGSVKDDAAVAMSGDVVFRSAFVNKIYSRKLVGGTAMFNRFFDDAGAKIVQPHELPTSGQVSDFLLRKTHGVIDYHLGDMRPETTNTTSSLYFIFDQDRYRADAVIGRYQKPTTDWMNQSFRDKIIHIFDRMFNSDPEQLGFKIHASSFSGGSISVTDSVADNGNFKNLRAGIDIVDDAAVLDTQVFTVLNSVDVAHPDTNLRSIIVNDNNYRKSLIKKASGIAFTYESGDGHDDYPLGTTADKAYGFLDFGKYFLRMPNNTHCERDSSTEAMTWLQGSAITNTPQFVKFNKYNGLSSTATVPYMDDGKTYQFLMDRGLRGGLGATVQTMTSNDYDLDNESGYYFRSWQTQSVPPSASNIRLASFGATMKKVANVRQWSRYFVEQYDGVAVRRLTLPTPDRDCEILIASDVKKPQFIGVEKGLNSQILSSSDGVVWKNVISTNTSIYGVAANGDTIVCCCSNGVWVSQNNGLDWVRTGLGNWLSVGYGNGAFVCMSESATHVSTDNGVSWTQYPIIGDITDWYCIVYSAALFVAVGRKQYSGHWRETIHTSTDGMSWTQRYVGTDDTELYGVCYGNGKFIAVGSTGHILSSTNGTSWTLETTASGGIDGICYGPSGFVAVGATTAMRSADGSTWTITTMPSQPYSVVYGNGKYITSCRDGSVYASANAITWSLISTINSTILSQIICPEMVKAGQDIITDATPLSDGAYTRRYGTILSGADKALFGFGVIANRSGGAFQDTRFFVEQRCVGDNTRLRKISVPQVSDDGLFVLSDVNGVVTPKTPYVSATATSVHTHDFNNTTPAPITSPTSTQAGFAPPSSGVFTVPCDGIYHLSYTATAKTGVGRSCILSVCLYKNASALLSLGQEISTVVDASFTVNAVYKLNKNDKLKLMEYGDLRNDYEYTLDITDLVFVLISAT